MRTYIRGDLREAQLARLKYAMATLLRLANRSAGTTRSHGAVVVLKVVGLAVLALWLIEGGVLVVRFGRYGKVRRAGGGSR